MKLHKRIERMIGKKLGYTNGWSIPQKDYDKLIEELTTQLIYTIETELNVGKALKKLEMRK